MFKVVENNGYEKEMKESWHTKLKIKSILLLKEGCETNMWVTFIFTENKICIVRQF